MLAEVSRTLRDMKKEEYALWGCKYLSRYTKPPLYLDYDFFHWLMFNLNPAHKVYKSEDQYYLLGKQNSIVHPPGIEPFSYPRSFEKEDWVRIISRLYKLLTSFARYIPSDLWELYAQKNKLRIGNVFSFIFGDDIDADNAEYFIEHLIRVLIAEIDSSEEFECKQTGVILHLGDDDGAKIWIENGVSSDPRDDSSDAFDPRYNRMSVITFGTKNAAGEEKEFKTMYGMQQMISGNQQTMHGMQQQMVLLLNRNFGLDLHFRRHGQRSQERVSTDEQVVFPKIRLDAGGVVIDPLFNDFFMIQAWRKGRKFICNCVDYKGERVSAVQIYTAARESIWIEGVAVNWECNIILNGEAVSRKLIESDGRITHWMNVKVDSEGECLLNDAPVATVKRMTPDGRRVKITFKNAALNDQSSPYLIGAQTGRYLELKCKYTIGNTLFKCRYQYINLNVRYTIEPNENPDANVEITITKKDGDTKVLFEGVKLDRKGHILACEFPVATIHIIKSTGLKVIIRGVALAEGGRVMPSKLPYAELEVIDEFGKVIWHRKNIYLKDDANIFELVDQERIDFQSLILEDGSGNLKRADTTHPDIDVEVRESIDMTPEAANVAATVFAAGRKFLLFKEGHERQMDSQLLQVHYCGRSPS